MVTHACLTHRILFFLLIRAAVGSCATYMWNLSFQGSNLCPLRWKLRTLTTGFSGNSRIFVLLKSSFRFFYLDIHFCHMCLLCIQKNKKKGNWLRQSYTLFTFTIQFSFNQFPLELSTFPQSVTPCAIRRCCISPSKPHPHPACFHQKAWIANFQSLPPSHRSSYCLLADGATAHQNSYAASCVGD